ncbi:class I SAM-dependent methyltransferase [Mesorhizobium sp. M1182]|uniref:class I SAM-dependent methyltransferase n=1 Tax=Mesorhizobium sp. M1182 TaxID=2957067 RepID=UPI00333C3E36
MTNNDMMTWEEAVSWLKSQPDKARLVEACFYDDPILQSAERFYSTTEWHETQRILSGRRGRALDIGAGRGISSFALAKDGWQVTALEPDPSPEVGAGAVFRLAREANLPIDVVTDWGEKLPFDDASFDLVYCRAVLHHARDLNRLCAEAGRVLRSGGLMLAAREHVISNDKDLDVFLRGHPLHHLYGGEKAYRKSEYIFALTQAGLTLSHVLNPFQSDINLFPDTPLDLKRRWSKKLRLPWPAIIPDFALPLAGAVTRGPGRLYSFVARKA